jgi:hypothetical protein
MIELKETLELSKELLDTTAFIFLTPEIIKNPLQEWASRLHGTAIGRDQPILARRFAALAKSVAEENILMSVAVAWTIAYFVVSVTLVIYFDVFGMVDYTSLQSILLMLLGIVSFIVVGVVGIILTVSISSSAIKHVLETGVSKSFLVIGLTAFGLARVCGITALQLAH